jgi:PKD repeat protein
VRAILRAVSLVVGAVALLGPASAHAATFCVHHTGCQQVSRNFNTIQLAVDEAKKNDSPNPIKDTILVGTGDYDPFTNASGHPIDLVGSGPATVVRVPGDSGSNNTVAKLGDPADTMRDLTVRLPAGGSNTGVVFGTLTGVDVRSAGVQTGSSQGVLGTEFTHGTIEVPGGTGATAGSVTRAVVSAHNGLNDAAALDSIVRVSGSGGVGERGNALQTTRVSHVDLLGDGSAGTIAVDAVADNGSDSNITVESSIIRGFATNFVQTGTTDCPTLNCPPDAFQTHAANVSVAYSDFDPAVPNQKTGMGVLNTNSPGQNTAADPGFVSASDLHLRFDSALVDSADPSSPGMGDPTVDLDGLPRKVDGIGSGRPRADIGAFEYQRRPPAITAESASATTASVHAPVTFHGAATDPDGEALTLTWDFGDGQSATGADVTHVYEAAGPHTVRLTARDPAGLSASAGIALDVVNQPPALTASSMPAGPLVGEIVAFHSVASDPEGEPVTVVWDFGDGQQATGSDPAHAYTPAGIKTVTATATDPQGLSAVQTLHVAVVAPVVGPLTCRVPTLKGRTLKAARAAIKRALCAVGKVRSPRVKRGHKRPRLVVRSQSPKAGKTVPRGTKVNLTLGP